MRTDRVHGISFTALRILKVLHTIGLTEKSIYDILEINRSSYLKSRYIKHR